MKNVTKYRHQLRQFETEISELVGKLRASYPKIPLCLVDKVEDFEPDFLEMRNDITGDVFDTHLLFLDTNGFRVAEVNYTSEEYTVELYDFSSIEDRINVLEIVSLQIEAINNFLAEFGTEVYDMPISDLELKMDNHKCITWGNKEYFIPTDALMTESEGQIYELLVHYNHFIIQTN